MGSCWCLYQLTTLFLCSTYTFVSFNRCCRSAVNRYGSVVCNRPTDYHIVCAVHIPTTTTNDNNNNRPTEQQSVWCRNSKMELNSLSMSHLHSLSVRELLLNFWKTNKKKENNNNDVLKLYSINTVCASGVSVDFHNQRFSSNTHTYLHTQTHTQTQTQRQSTDHHTIC